LALIEFARGTKLREAAKRPENTPAFQTTNWGNTLEKAQSSFNKMQIPGAKEL